jgi:hypothetical protein
MLDVVRVNKGAQQEDRNVVARGSEASADNRCLIIGTGLMRSPVGRIATARQETVKMKLYRRFNRCRNTRPARDKQGPNIRHTSLLGMQWLRGVAAWL